tara:strand:+ start:7883 stop:8347 length:465 start_codon:yes stop_codon:yes gene_type:complete
MIILLLTFEILFLSLLITSFTVGLRIISNKGMVLHPLRKLVIGLYKPKEKDFYKDLLKDKRKELKTAILSDSDKEIKKIKIAINTLEYKIFKLDAWHKPLLTCAPCMSSFHGLWITAFCWFVLSLNLLPICIFSIFLSVILNHFTFKKFEDGIR